MPTSPRKALQDAKNRLNDNPDDLEKSIEEQIQTMLPHQPYIYGRGGHYTKRARDIVIEKYRKAGWIVEDTPYWINLYPPKDDSQ